MLFSKYQISFKPKLNVSTGYLIIRSSTLHFPGFSNELAQALAGKAVALGVDTASADAGQATDFKV